MTTRPHATATAIAKSDERAALSVEAATRLRAEAERFALRYTCEACSHFDGERCGNGWPTREHRLPIARESVATFCKEFEMA